MPAITVYKSDVIKLGSWIQCIYIKYAIYNNHNDVVTDSKVFKTFPNVVFTTLPLLAKIFFLKLNSWLKKYIITKNQNMTNTKSNNQGLYCIIVLI